MNCLLCQEHTFVKCDGVFECGHCGLVFKNPQNHLNTSEEAKRYSNHENSFNDEGYVNFLKKLTNPLSSFLPNNFKALDFGCGPGPTLHLLLKEKGGEVCNYDPIFFPADNALADKYDVVTSSEVVEHFKSPIKDWELLSNLLKPGGLLAIMTQFFHSETDYLSWWYKNDPTHVVFYKLKTFEFLAKKYSFKILFNDNHSVIILKKE